MRRRSARATIVVLTAAACTAGPVVLPRGPAPAPPAPCAERRIRIDVGGEQAVVGSRVLGRSWVPGTDSDRVRWFDPVTLRRTGPYHALPEQTGIWAVSPDGELVAISLRASVRVIDTRTLREVASLERLGGSSRLAWVTDRVLIGLDGNSHAFVWDERSRSLRRYTVADGIVATFSAADRLLLVSGWRGAGAGGLPPQLIEITADGVRSVALDRIDVFDPDRGEVGVELVPGLAYDQGTMRAYVVPPEGPIAEIDLVPERPVVRYRSPPASFVERLAGSFLGTAEAKLGEWETVRAAWLGGGFLAVSGETGSTMGPDGTAAGVSIVDTRTWEACLLEPGPTHVAVSDGVLLAWGGADFGELGGTGLVGYDLEHGDRWHRFGRQYLDVQVGGPYAYAINSWDGWRVRTVDLATGEVIARLQGRPPTVLPTGASGAW